MRRTLLAAAVTTIVTAAAATTADATFPGENGPIAYRTVDGETGLGVPLFRAQPGRLAGDRAQRAGRASSRTGGRTAGASRSTSSSADGDQQIATTKPDGSDLRVITSGPGIHEVPSWSPSGRRIVFGYSPDLFDPEAPEDFEIRLWTMRSDGSHARPLPMRRPGFDAEPRYSPNGRWITFARTRPPTKKREFFQTAIFIVKAKGGRVHRLTPWADYPDQPSPQDAYPEHPTWSPDSRWILFNLGPNGTIQRMRPDGSDRHSIVEAREGFGGHKPWYSPDGSRILFVCENWGTLPEPPRASTTTSAS